MLRNVFPDEPVGDDNVATADTPGAFFAEFLPKDIKVRTADNAGSATTDRLQPTAAERQQQQQQLGDEDTLSDQTTHACPADVQVKLEGQQTAAQAAAAAQASAAEATAAACAAASRAAQQATAAAGDHSAPSGAAQAAGDGVEDTDSDFDLPSIAEIRSALAESWFGNGEADPTGTSTTNGKAAGREAQQNEEDAEGLLEKLLPFGKDGPLRRKTAGLVPTFKAKHKPKPLRLKLAEQVLSKEMLSAVQVVEQEILSSTDPLASATIKFFLKAGRNMGQGWARKNLPRVCGLFSAYVAATCGVMHGLKAATKWLAWRIPRVGKRAVGPAVSFTSDVLLPTPFFGPFLATYVLLMLVCRDRKQDEGEGQEAAEAAAGDNPAPDGSSTEPQQQQQQQVVVERTRSRELQLEFVVDSPPPHDRGIGQVRRGRHLARATSIKGKVKRAVGSSRPCPQGAAAAAAAAADTPLVSKS